MLLFNLIYKQGLFGFGLRQIFQINKNQLGKEKLLSTFFHVANLFIKLSKEKSRQERSIACRQFIYYKNKNDVQKSYYKLYFLLDFKIKTLPLLLFFKY